MTIRRAVEGDATFLGEMLVLAADWRPGSAPRAVRDALADPALGHYVLGWPRPHDFGVIADDERGVPIGAAWARRFPAEDPGYGFVSPHVPEVAIAVVAEARGRGAGRSLLLALIDEARDRRVDRLSLSVEPDNPARGLYHRVGFVAVAEDDSSVTMVLHLD